MAYIYNLNVLSYFKKEILDVNDIYKSMAIKYFFTTSNDFISRISRSMTNVYVYASKETIKKNSQNRRNICKSYQIKNLDLEYIEFL